MPIKHGRASDRFDRLRDPFDGFTLAAFAEVWYTLNYGIHEKAVGTMQKAEIGLSAELKTRPCFERSIQREINTAYCMLPTAY